MDTEELHHIQVLALNAVENPDYHASYRKITRWYSEKFATPLLQVEELSEQHVLQAYFEDFYGELYRSDDKDDRQRYEDIRDGILVPTSERDEAKESDDAWIEQMNREVAESAKTEPNAKPPETQLITEQNVMGETEIPQD